MGPKDDINSAIAAHGMWKGRLKTAIEIGNQRSRLAK